MSTKLSISQALSLLLPAGVLGASLLLATSSAQAAASPSESEANLDQPGVAKRLQAIRSGMSNITTPAAEGSAEVEQAKGGLLPTWWGNAGWGRWHGGWGNGGWRFGWHNGWPNGWHNWGNGWNNWGNGWHNYWHNG